jgi:hypothetical protein
MMPDDPLQDYRGAIVKADPVLILALNPFE